MKDDVTSYAVECVWKCVVCVHIIDFILTEFVEYSTRTNTQWVRARMARNGNELIHLLQAMYVCTEFFVDLFQLNYRN